MRMTDERFFLETLFFCFWVSCSRVFVSIGSRFFSLCVRFLVIKGFFLEKLAFYLFWLWQFANLVRFITNWSSGPDFLCSASVFSLSVLCTGILFWVRVYGFFSSMRVRKNPGRMCNCFLVRVYFFFLSYVARPPAYGYSSFFVRSYAAPCLRIRVVLVFFFFRSSTCVCAAFVFFFSLSFVYLRLLPFSCSSFCFGDESLFHQIT